MAVVKMKKFHIAGLKKDLDKLSGQIINGSNMQLIGNNQFQDKINLFSRDNPYKNLFNRVGEIMDNLDIDRAACRMESEEIVRIDLQEINKKIKPINKRIARLEKVEARLKKEEQRLIDLKHHVRLMRNMDIDLDELRNLSHIALIFGSVDIDGYDRVINNVTDLPILILEVFRDDEKVWFFTFTKKIHEEEALDILESVYFDEIKLPPRVKGHPSEILERANYRLERIEIISEQIELEYKKLAHRYGGCLSSYYSYLKLMDKISEISNHFYGESEHLFLLSGWVRADEEGNFLEKLETQFPEVIYESQGIIRELREDSPPTVLKNPVWVKPFESLVRLYGIPDYGELDPSIFLAVTYILMFGMMFGDLGQGFVFFLLGVLIYQGRIKVVNQDNSYLFISLGLSSMVFGIFYGSVFGLEDLIPALVIRPMDQIMFWLGLTVVFGIFLIIVSMLFNLYNSYRNKELAAGVFSRSGLSGFFFYLFLLASAASYALRGKWLLPLPFTVTLLILPLLLMFFEEPLLKLIRGEEDPLPDNLTSYIIESFFELFDIVLGYLSNTISFVRIGAFTLNHFGLSMTVMILAGMIENSFGGIAIIIFGNIVIMVLEGLIVGIQVLRLEFFELFGKFYHGDGQEFQPVKLD